MLKPNVFISYKRRHDPSTVAIDPIVQALQQHNFGVLLDVEMEPGDIWSNELYKWLMQCSAAITFIGEEPAKSEWCRREWWFLRERHRATGMPVIPVSIDGTRKSAGILDHLTDIKDLSAAPRRVLTKLKKLAPARPAAADYLAAHHAWLRWQFNHQPVWGREPFPLAHVYVETECGKLPWGKLSDERKPLDPFRDDADHGGRHNLVDTVMGYLADPQFRDLVVVQGPPGCGKSAFTLRLANELLARNLQPILVRFRDFRLSTFTRADDLIEDALRIGPTDEEPPRPDATIITDDALNRVTKLGEAQIGELVFILDGWDEVSLTGNASYQAQLASWLPRIREFFTARTGKPVRLIMTGRPSNEVRNSGVLTKNTPVLTVRPMKPDDLKAFATRIADKVNNAPSSLKWPAWTLDIRRLDSIFVSYGNWFKSSGKIDASMDVIGNPLLAFLAFRTLADWPGDPKELLDKPTALYKVLIDTTVQHAGKGRDEGVENAVHRGGERLRYLLQKVASVISVFGRKSVSFKELDLRLTDDPEFRKWYQRDGGLRRAVDDAARQNALYELVVNFYFKGGNTGIGCEFLHKSFREYLHAELIVAALARMSEGRSGPLKAPDVAYWQDFEAGTPQHEASRALATLLSPQWLTEEVRGHLVWLIRADIQAEPTRWTWLRDVLLDVYIWWAEGVLLRPQPTRSRDSRGWSPAYVHELLEHALPIDSETRAEPMRSATLDAHLGSALMQITAVVFDAMLAHKRIVYEHASLRHKYTYKAEDGVRFAPGGGFFANLCARINARTSAAGAFPAKAWLPAVALVDETLDGGSLLKCNLSKVWLSDCRVIRVSFAGSN